MAPVPAAGRSEAPKTPTKTGKQPESSSTSKLTSRESPKSATSTPRRPPKLGAPKSAKKAEDRESLRPKTEDDKEKAESSAGDLSSEPYQKIGMKDNEEEETLPHDDDDDQSTSVADTSDLGQAEPKPIDDDENTLSGAQNPRDKNNIAAADEGTGSEDAAGEAEDESDPGASKSVGPAASDLKGVDKGVEGKVTDDIQDSLYNTGDNSSINDGAGPSKDEADSTKDTSQDTAGATKDTAQDATSNLRDSADDDPDDIHEEANDTIKTSQKASDAVNSDKVTDEQALSNAEGAAEEKNDNVKETAEPSKDKAEVSIDSAKDKAEATLKPNTDTLNHSADVVGDDSQSSKDEVGDATDKTQQEAKGATQGSRDAKDDVEEKVDSGTEDVTDQLKDNAPDDVSLPDDLSSLKGFKVRENGDILDDSGKLIGKLEEGDPADLEGYEIGDDGEILDEDGDVVGRASLISQTADKADDRIQGQGEDVEGNAGDDEETYLPDLNVLKGLEVQKNGDVQDASGNTMGRITEGDPADLVGMTLNEDGEILDEDGDVVGRAETLPQKVQQQIDEAGGQQPGVEVLEGLTVGDDGTIKDNKGAILGNITEGDPKDLAGRTVNAEGEVLDEDGDVIGRANVVPETAGVDGRDQERGKGEMPEAIRVQDIEDQLRPNLDIIEGRKLNKKGNILDDEGDVLARLVEGDARECAGKLPNENGEIADDEGNIIGRVEVVAGGAAEEAMKEIHPELVDELEKAQIAADEASKDAQDAGDAEKDAKSAADVAEDAIDKAEDAADDAKEFADSAKPDFAQLEGLKVNKKGEVVNEDGDPIARLANGELDEVRGKKINNKGEILDKDGKVIGKVEFIADAIEQGMVDVQDAPEQPPTSFLDGYKVNKKGDVLDEDGKIIARLSDGELEEVAGKKLNEKGEILDKEGNVIGKVELVQDDEQDEKSVEADAKDSAKENDEGLPPLSNLQGFKVNKSGNIIDNNGQVIGELAEGDAKKIWKLGATADEEGQFWDGRGHVIGRGKTVPLDQDAEEGEFAGLDGLIVVKEGWVEDENGNRVGRLTEGDAKKLVGRAVDEDGDVIDKRGNVVGHAERYEEPEEEIAPEDDLSELKGLTPNKQGNVVGRDGVPVARLVEGNPKELAGRKIDENGQIWNDAGKVVGRCELIPPGEREARPEGPFAGLEGLVVVKDGFVEDADGNVVGQVTEGDAKKLIGRSVDEDGDIIDKYGNVKGHVEPYEAPEEPEEAPEDLSALAGKSVNKQGKIVDEHGTIFGEVSEGDPKRLIGCKVDDKGQIWSNDGKVIGRGRLIAGGDDGRAEGPFSNFESTIVSKDGLVKDANGEIVGRVIEGDSKKLVGRKVDDDGDIVDKNGNVIGKAERWEPEEKAREVSLMAGLRVNKEGEVRDKNGDLIGRLTDGNLLHCIGREINDNGYVVDQDGNKLGEVTLLENIQEEEEEEEEVGLTEEEQKEKEEKEIAKKISNILTQTIDKMEPICKQIDEAVDRADRTPKEELDEEALVNEIKPLIEEGGRILNECNGSIRGLDPDGHIAAQAKARHASGEASPEEHRVAEGLKDLTGRIVKCIDNAKKKIADMPHAKKKLSPLWALLTEPLFQIIAAVGLLLSGVLGLVGKLLNALGLGGLVNGILGGLGINKLLDGIGLGSIGESLGLGGGKKKK